MPSLDGKKLVSETISRKRSQCRVVITLEVEVNAEGLASLPRWAHDSTDYVKPMFENHPKVVASLDALVNAFNHGYTKVSAVKTEALK